MNTKPEYMNKHKCTNEACDTGYIECAQLRLMNLQCCCCCNHPTRWSDPQPYTKEEILEMWEGREIPPYTQEQINRMT